MNLWSLALCKDIRVGLAFSLLITMGPGAGAGAGMGAVVNTWYCFSICWWPGPGKCWWCWWW